MNKTLRICLLAALLPWAPAFASDITDSAGLGSPGSTNYSQVPVDWANIRNKPPTATRWPTWSEIRNEYGQLPLDLIQAPDGFPVEEHDHDDRYLKHTGGSMSGQLTMNHHLRINSSTLRLSQSYFRATIDSKKDLDEGNPGFFTITYNNYIPDGYGIPNLIKMVSNDYYGRSRTGVISFHRINRDEDGEGRYPALADDPGGNVHLAEIVAHGFDEDAPPKLDGNGEIITAYSRTAARMYFLTDGAWTDESKGSIITFHNRSKDPAKGMSQRLRINSNGAITLGDSSAAPTHHLYLSGGPDEDVSRGINVNNKVWLGEDHYVYTGADLRMDANGHIYSDTTLHFNNSNGRYRFYKNPNPDCPCVDDDAVIVAIEPNGDIVTAGTVRSPSDERLKTDIIPLEGVLDKLEHISPVTYTWIDGPRAEVGSRDIGLLAQDVQEAFPELVTEDGESGYLTLNYSGMVAPLVGAVKELNQRANSLEAAYQEARLEDAMRIETLEARIEEYEETRLEDAARIETLETRIADLENLLEGLLSKRGE